tara:strand:- start:238 stop:798 length:561 start_codon:yes stop_codon:yes gene_type:complete
LKKSLKQFHQDHEDIYIFLQDNDNREGNSFLEDVWKNLVRKREISINQINGVRNSMLYYQKKIEQENLKEFHKDDEPTGSFVGKVRKRYDMTLKYVSGKSTSRGFYVHNFVDREDNSLMCFSNNRYLYIEVKTGPDIEIKKGDCMTGRATVNRHSINDFDPTNKIKQTVLNRIKFNKYLGNKNNEE